MLVFGQDPAIDALTESIKMSRAGLGNEQKPIGAFLLAGPTGRENRSHCAVIQSNGYQAAAL